ncbi:hypothetical protein EOD23_30565 [Mesorhizobium sp. USDA-HM6]|nr:hypothetical protein EOD23_30565 [Mesorhizobium sp. USDA-HM6]
MKPHQPLNQAPPFRAGNEVYAPIARERRSVTAGLVVSRQAFEADADGSGKLGLRDIRLGADGRDLSTDMLVSDVWIAFSFRFCPRLEEAGALRF